MISDKQLMFGSAIDLSQTAATYNTTISDTVDTAPLYSGNEGRNLGSTMFALFFIMTEALSTGSSPTLQIQLFSGATAGAVTNKHIDTGALTAASLTAGRTLVIPLPYDSALPYLRYLQMQFIIAVATTTTGIASAGLVPTADVPRLFVSATVP